MLGRVVFLWPLIMELLRFHLKKLRHCRRRPIGFKLMLAIKRIMIGTDFTRKSGFSTDLLQLENRGFLITMHFGPANLPCHKFSDMPWIEATNQYVSFVG